MELSFNPRNALQCLPRLVLWGSYSAKRRIELVVELFELLALIHCLVTISVTLGSPLFGGRSLAHRK